MNEQGRNSLVRHPRQPLAYAARAAREAAARVLPAGQMIETLCETDIGEGRVTSRRLDGIPLHPGQLVV